MSGYIGNAPVPQSTQTRQTFTATSGQTSFATVGYVAGGQFIQVYLNGVLLKLTDDYTAANGSDIVLTSGAATGDVLEFITFADFTVNNQNFTGGLTVDNDGSTVLTVDRATSDGTIIDLQKSGSSVGNIGVDSSNAYISGTTRGLHFTGPAGIIPCNEAGASRDADTDLGTSSTRFKDLYLSGGVWLGGTGSANKLDDYEIGTWTPTLNAGFTVATINRAAYTKIGRLVHIQVDMTFTGTGTAADLYMAGLPFTSANHGWSTGSGYFQRVNNNYYMHPTPLVRSGETNLVWQINVSTNIGELMPANNIDAGYMQVSVTYQTP